VAASHGRGGAGAPARGLALSGPDREHRVRAGGLDARVWEKGRGAPLGFLGGFHGLPRWTAFLDRLAERRRVVAPSLPGFPGADGHRELDDVLDWVTATLDLLEACGLAGRDLVGVSVGGTLAAEVAALSHRSVGRLVLIAPFGLFDASEPPADPWATRRPELSALLSAYPETLETHLARPPEEDEMAWQIVLTRASEAAARLLWPLGDTGLAKRLHRVHAPTLLLWGADDRVLPATYAKRLADGIAGFSRIRSIEGAGHTVELDQPDPTADAVLEFL